jgi:hypothetical protein
MGRSWQAKGRRRGEYRKYPYRSEAYRARERKRNRARREAVNALIRAHRAEYFKLYRAELEHAGLWPPEAPGRRGGGTKPTTLQGGPDKTTEGRSDADQDHD